MALLAQQAADEGHEVELIDSPIGVVAKMIQHRSDIKIKIFDGKNRLHLKNCVVVTQASYAFCLTNMLEMEQCDIRFWFMHPLNLPHMYLSKRLGNFVGGIFKRVFFKSYKQKLSFISDSMYFQSDDTRQGIEQFYDIKLTENYTGLLSEIREVKPANPYDICGASIELSWLGRLDSGSKLLVIKKLLRDLHESQYLDHISKFHIIGDGPAKKAIIDFVNEKNLTDRVEVHGHVQYEKLPEILRRSILVFAHGTSVYEAVSCHVPVSIVDFYNNEQQVNRMQYSLYSDNSDLTLGYMINSNEDPRIESGRTFDKLIEEVNVPSEVSAIASKQLKKYEVAREQGAINSRILYSEPYNFSHKKQELLLDTLFFSFRSMLLRMKKQRV